MSRRRWVYTQGGQPLPEPIEVSDDWQPEARSGPRRSEEEIYGQCQSTDGADLSTRRRHREHMERNGLVMASEFKQTWADAREQRRKYFQADGYDKKARRETLARAMYETTKRKK